MKEGDNNQLTPTTDCSWWFTDNVRLVTAGLGGLGRF